MTWADDLAKTHGAASRKHAMKMKKTDLTEGFVASTLPQEIDENISVYDKEKSLCDAAFYRNKLSRFSQIF